MKTYSSAKSGFKYNCFVDKKTKLHGLDNMNTHTQFSNTTLFIEFRQQYQILKYTNKGSDKEKSIKEHIESYKYTMTSCCKIYDVLQCYWQIDFTK